MFGLDTRALLGKDGTKLCLKGIEEVSDCPRRRQTMAAHPVWVPVEVLVGHACTTTLREQFQ